MKQVFFFGVLVLLPIVIIGGGTLYLIWHTCYALYDNWKLNRELAEIRAAAQAKRGRAAGVPEEEPTTDA